jgi:hypothetical protein
VDLDAETLYVAGARRKVEIGYALGPTKKARAERVLELPASVFRRAMSEALAWAASLRSQPRRTPGARRR